MTAFGCVLAHICIYEKEYKRAREGKQARKQKGEDAWLERSLAAKQLGVFVTVSNCLKVHANSFLCSTAITFWDQYVAAQEATHR